MKKLTLLITLFFMTVSVFAQNWQEVLYLKNGSAIRGVIIEQIPNKSVKIQTADGSVFVYDIDEVERIAKEQKVKGKDTPAEKHKYPNRGYRGAVSLSYIAGDEVEGFSLATVHGVQIFPRLYVGSGLELQSVDYLDVEHFGSNSTIRIVNGFDQIRCDIIKSRITPFVGLRTGLRFSDECDFYFSPSVGCRFGHFNLSIAYDEIPYTYTYGHSGYGYYGALVMQLAIDFGSR